MSLMTLDDLREILVECAGEDDSNDVSGDIADVPFEDLGYDSLALMETAARIEQRFGVRLPDEQVMELATPKAVLDAVNTAAATA
ncbi:acyl carrier protein [Micromonospora maritima]|uniref:Acyl carrier protein n=1 Tax=Micromonospora maritima TaxID=986711 RepID=A0ABW7ZJH9_9ACTN|nr:acyl carrier protein [Micromonospora maritima]